MSAQTRAPAPAPKPTWPRWLPLVLLGICAPIALAGAVTVNKLLRRWPDRLAAGVALAVGVGGAALLWAPHYLTAWSRVTLGNWPRPAPAWPPWLRSEPLLRPVLSLRWWPRSPTWSDVGLVVVSGLVYGLLLGAMWWTLTLRRRERALHGGEDVRRRRERVEAKRRRLGVRLVQWTAHGSHLPVLAPVARRRAVPLGDDRGPFLGIWEGGELAGAFRAGRFARLPLTGRGAVQHAIILGATGEGKTESVMRICEWTIRAGQQLIYASFKQPSDAGELADLEGSAALRLTHLAASNHQTIGVLIGNGIRPYDPMRGTRDEIRDKFLAIEEWGDRFYEHCGNVLLTLALELSAAVGQDVRSLPELVAQLSEETLAELNDGLGGDTRVRRLVRAVGKNGGAAGAMVRYASLAMRLRGWIGSAGGWAPEDVDVACLEFPTSSQAVAARSLGRVFLRDLDAYMHGPRRQRTADGRRRPLTLVLEELGWLSGDPVVGPEVVNLLERARSAGVHVVVTAQGPGGLGDQTVQDALMTNAAIVTYRQAPGAEQLAKLSGSRLHEEASTTWDEAGLGTGGSTRLQDEFRLHPNVLRELDPFQAAIIARGLSCTVAAAMAPTGYGVPDSPEVLELGQLLQASAEPQSEPAEPLPEPATPTWRPPGVGLIPPPPELPPAEAGDPR